MTEVHTFRTPGGNAVRMHVRPGTCDANVCIAILHEDEYRIRGRSFDGFVLDVGAYLGAFTVAVLADNPHAHVIAVEPLAANVALIAENVALNGFGDRVLVIHGGAGAPGDGPVRIGAVDDGVHGFIGSAAAGEDVDVPGELVDRWSFTNLVAPSDRGRVQAVKIDCEGCEWRFLTDPAVASVPRIVGEVHAEAAHAVTDLHAVLGGSHTVRIDGEDQPGPRFFEAVRR